MDCVRLSQVVGRGPVDAPVVSRLTKGRSSRNLPDRILNDGGLGISTHSTSENKTSDDELNRECGYGCTLVR